MTLPSNDAFTLSLVHDAHHSRSARSQSPKTSSPKATLASSGNGIKNIRRQVIRQLPNLQPVHVEVVQVSHYDISGDTTPQQRTQNAMNDVHIPAAPSPEQTPVKKVDWEIPRKLLHSSIGFYTIYLYTSHGSPRTVVGVLFTALAVIIPADILRFSSPSLERVYERYLGFLMRESERNSINGVIWYILGVNFALCMYPLDIATVSILILSWADTAASTFGRLYGAYTPPLPRRIPFLPLRLSPRKSLAGFLAASITGTCVAIGFWGWIAPTRPTDLSWSWYEGVGEERSKIGGWLGLSMIGLVAGIVSGVAEALDLGFLDDNLTLPIISGGCLLGFLKFLELWR